MKQSNNPQNIFNNDVKKLAKHLSNFLKIYSQKSLILKQKTQDLKHSDFLNISSRILGYSDYNQLRKYDNCIQKNNEDIINNFKRYIESIEIDYIDEISNCFNVYITSTESEISNVMIKIRAKIQRRIKKLMKDSDTWSEGKDIARLFDIIKKTGKFSYLLSYESIIFGHRESKAFNEIIALLYIYYDNKNAYLIKKTIKDNSYGSHLSESLYQLDSFISKEYGNIYKTPCPYEYLEYEAKEYEFFHAKLKDSYSHKAMREFNAKILSKMYGNTVIYKGIFNTLNEEGKQYLSNITRSLYNEDCIFKITLANQDEFSIIIKSNSDVFFAKDFDGKILYEKVIDFNGDRVRYVIPIAKKFRYQNEVERFSYFYPEHKNDYFVFKIIFEDDTHFILKINNSGFIHDEDEHEIVSFKTLASILYYKNSIGLMNEYKTKIQEQTNYMMNSFKKELDDIFVKLKDGEYNCFEERELEYEKEDNYINTNKELISLKEKIIKSEKIIEKYYKI